MERKKTCVCDRCRNAKDKKAAAPAFSAAPKSPTKHAGAVKPPPTKPDDAKTEAAKPHAKPAAKPVESKPIEAGIAPGAGRGDAGGAGGGGAGPGAGGVAGAAGDAAAAAGGGAVGAGRGAGVGAEVEGAAAAVVARDPIIQPKAERRYLLPAQPPPLPKLPTGITLEQKQAIEIYAENLKQWAQTLFANPEPDPERKGDDEGYDGEEVGGDGAGGDGGGGDDHDAPATEEAEAGGHDGAEDRDLPRGE